jgi:WD40 repeat protein
MIQTWALLPPLFLVAATFGDQPRLDMYGDPLPKSAVARLGTVRFRHGGCSPFAVEFLGDGKTIVTGGIEDGKLRFWDAATGKLRHAIGVLEDGIWCMALAPDGKTCAVAGPRGAALWDVEARKLIHAMKAGSVSALAFSPDGKTLVTGGDGFDALLRVYDVAAGKERRRMKWHDRRISRILIGPDNRTVISVSSAGRKVHVCDLDSGEETRSITDRSWHNLNAVELLPDGKTLLIAGGRMVELYDLATGKRIRMLEKMALSITGAHLLPGGKELMAIDYDGNVRRWDVATWKPLPPLPGPGWFDRVSPDGRIGLQCAGASLAVYDLASGKPLHDFDGHTGVIESLAFSREGDLLASLQSGTDIDLRVWEVAKSKTVRKLIGHPAKQAFVCAILSAPDGFVTGASDGTLRLWDGASGKQLRLFHLEGREQVLTMAVSADAKRLLCTSGGFEFRREKLAITVFDLATGKQLRRREENSDRVFYWPRFAPDGRSLVKHAEKGLVRVEVDTGKELCRFTAPDILEDPVVFTPDGRMLAVRSCTQKKDGPRYWHGDRKVRVFDTATGQQRFVVDSAAWTQPLAFTPDGRLLAAVAERVVVLFDSASGQQRWRSPELDHRIHAVAFAPDATTLASSQSDGTILIWDITQPAR